MKFKKLLFSVVFILGFGVVYHYYGNYMLYAVTLFEQKISRPIIGFQTKIAKSRTLANAPCNPVIIAHRGNYQENVFPQNSQVGISSAINHGLKKLEIDLTFFEDGVVLDHGPVHMPVGSFLKDYHPSDKPPFRLETFFENFAPHFELIIFDLKEILTTQANQERAVELLSHFPFDPKHHIFIGLNCRFVKKVQERLHIKSGCEMQGVFANWFLGFEIWSAHFRTVTALQTRLNTFARLEPLLWTYEDLPEVYGSCDQVNPSMAIVDRL